MKKFFLVGVMGLWNTFLKRSCGCPFPGRAQGHAGQGSGQPGLVEDVSAHGRCAGTKLSLIPFSPKPFCDSMMISMKYRQERVSHMKFWWPMCPSQILVGYYSSVVKILKSNVTLGKAKEEKIMQLLK